MRGRNRTAVRRLQVVDVEAEGADVVAMRIVRRALTEIEEEEGIALTELPVGLRRATVCLADVKLRPERAFVELDRLLEVPYPDVEGDRPEALH